MEKGKKIDGHFFAVRLSSILSFIFVILKYAKPSLEMPTISINFINF